MLIQNMHEILVWFIRRSKMEEEIRFPSEAYAKFHIRYKRKPWLLIEDYCGIKLKWWQKVKVVWMSIREKRNVVDRALCRYINKRR